MRLAELNAADPSPALVDSLRSCCAAPDWINAVIAARPYPDEQALFTVSDAATDALDDDGLATALAAHPRIGERRPGWSSQEQAGLNSADDALRAQLAAANARYEERFAQVYLVCATGLSAARLLEICLDRLDNDPVTERGIVLGELAKIARLRLSKLLASDPPIAPSTSDAGSTS
jgi:2-oxo-4-hydroxy-4-carboxy-5-ureidoimidazoline decarboxylase